jgi:hypothetical protein
MARGAIRGENQQIPPIWRNHLVPDLHQIFGFEKRVHSILFANRTQKRMAGVK